MAFQSLLFDSNNIPIPVSYVPGVGFVAMRGSAGTVTDGLGNTYTPLAIDIAQINDLPVQMAGTDGVTASNVLQVVNGRFNGRTVDQDRNNLDNITLISATNATTTQVSSMQINYNHRSVIVVFQTTAIGTGNLTLSIQGIEPVSNYTWTILSGTAVSTNTTTLYKITPNLSAVANSIAQDLLPRSWQVTVTANNANAATYAVYAIMLV